MKSLIVYHSQFGNTKALAEVMGKALEPFGQVGVGAIDDRTADRLKDIDLLVIAGPTQAHGNTPAVRSFLSAVKAKAPGGLQIAAFDTRLKGPEFLTGSAAKGIAKDLTRAGLRLVAPPESFLVAGKQPQLLEGELQRARSWATSLGDAARINAAA